MKKILSVLLVLSMLLTASAALAEGMGVQVIGGPTTETEPVSLDDLKLNVDAEIPGFGVLTLTEYKVLDYLGYYTAGQTYFYDGYSLHYYQSGNEADYVFLYADILNTTTAPKDYLASVEVKVIADDTYEFLGWYYQRNYDNKAYRHNTSDYPEFSSKQNETFAIDVADNFAISPMYKGHYIFGCTLPNAVITNKNSLRMVITIDGNEITYNIRK